MNGTAIKTLDMTAIEAEAAELERKKAELNRAETELEKKRRKAERQQAETESETLKDDRPLGLEEAAAFLGLSKNSLYQLVHGKKLPAYKPGGKKLYFKKSDLESYVFRNRSISDYEAAKAADGILHSIM